mgnify:FL=1
MTDAGAQENFDLTLTKYKTAGEIASKALKAVLDEVKAGKTVLELIRVGDEAVEKGTAAVFKGKQFSKGVAFPTTISINKCVWRA